MKEFEVTVTGIADRDIYSIECSKPHTAVARVLSGGDGWGTKEVKGRYKRVDGHPDIWTKNKGLDLELGESCTVTVTRVK